MQDTRETTPTAWSDHDGYDLTRYTLSTTPINSRDRYHPGLVCASVKAIKFTGQDRAFVAMDLDAGPASMEARMSPAEARKLARALLGAADIVEAFEAFEADRAESAELARYNAGPLTTRVDIAQGVVAFETAQTQGGAA